MRKYAFYTLAIVFIILTSCTGVEQQDELREPDDFQIETAYSPAQEKDIGTQMLDFKYSIIRLDMVFDTYVEFDLAESEAEELDKLLRKDRWQIASNIPDTGYMGGEGNDSVGLRDNDGNSAFIVKEKIGESWVTMIVLKNMDDPDRSVNYLAPIDVVLDLMQFAESIQQKQQSDIDNSVDDFDFRDYYQRIKQDLMEHPELIPCEGSLGGTMDFYMESDIFVTYKYAFAVAEDGHTSVYMLFSYEVDSDNVITWELIGYDVGAQGFSLVNSN